MRLFFTLFLSIFSFSLFSQECAPFSAKSTFIHNNFKYNILKGGEAYNELYYKVGIGSDGDMDSREYAKIIYSTNVWMGSKSLDGSTHFSGGTYTDQDWVPGQIDWDGEVDSEQCTNWDNVFTVTKEDIYKAREIYLTDGPCDEIPESVKSWPARGNPFSAVKSNDNSVNYWDTSSDAQYNPCYGDLPNVTFRGKEPQTLEEYFAKLPSQISLYIMNDEGSPNYFSSGNSLTHQVAVYVLSYQIEEANDIIFIKYSSKNKNEESSIDFGFGNWFDFDLGCKENDYIGTDAERNMVYVYNNSNDQNCNENANPLLNSQFGVTNLGGVFTPYHIVDNNGVDSLIDVSPDDSIGDTIVRSRLNNSIIPIQCQHNNVPNACYPSTPDEYYNILQAKNTDGSPILDNYGNETQIMYSGNPSDPAGWSLCTDFNTPQTTAVISSNSKFLNASANNEIILAYCYAKDSEDGCSNIAALQYQQSLAQKLYDNGFNHITGPTPPSIDVEEDNDGLLISLDNIPFGYSVKIPEADGSTEDRYNFEGIKIYQVKSSNFDLTELENIELSRLIYQGDISNDVDQISNWQTIFVDGTKNIEPIQKVNGNNIGVENQVLFDYDVLNDKPYEMGNPYYFVAVSYAYNNYKSFDIQSESGQKYPYLEGKCGLQTINSKVLLADEQVQIIKPYKFHQNGYNWSIQNSSKNLSVTLLSATGQKVGSWKIEPHTTLTSEQVNFIHSGIYFVKIEDQNSKKVFTQKLVIIN